MDKPTQLACDRGTICLCPTHAIANRTKTRRLERIDMTVMVRTLLPLAFCLLFCATVVAQSDRGPSTPEERATAVKSARLLETDPFNKDSKKVREWFLKWLIEIPDISVEICSDYLPPLYGKKNK